MQAQPALHGGEPCRTTPDEQPDRRNPYRRAGAADNARRAAVFDQTTLALRLSIAGEVKQSKHEWGSPEIEVNRRCPSLLA
jgi:hypothetical protein